MKQFILLIVVFSVCIVPLAYAHPFTLDSQPAPSSNVSVNTNQVIVHFSEPVEIEFSEIKVLDSNGEEIDNKDTKYYQGEDSLIVTTPPLQDGVYTVTTKVLSKIDGHLVPNAFSFAVGNAIVEKTDQESKPITDIIFLPEAGARFPGLVGETIVLGAVFASLVIWKTQNKQIIKKEFEVIEKIYKSKFMRITGIGLITVFVSNILILAVQAIRLETSVIQVLQTTFGVTWEFRMIVTIILLGLWFVMEKSRNLDIKKQVIFLIISLVLIGTSSLIGHGAASGKWEAIVLDYVHNFVASVWIGGIIFFVYALLPTFSVLDSDKKEKMSLLMIPRFSIAFVIALGVVIISGPTLMWFLEGNVSLIVESIYGKLIFAKIGIAVIMVAIGGYFQYNIQNNAESGLKSGKISVHKKLSRSLKYDVVLGIILLGVVALLTNGTLPAGEIPSVEAQHTVYGFSTTKYSENLEFGVEITPFGTGTNNILVNIREQNNDGLSDINELKVKISNPQRNIAPVEVQMEKFSKDKQMNTYKGEMTIGFSGKWLIEIEAQRKNNANESVMIDVLVKPKLSNLNSQIIEYPFPEDAKPLYPISDGKGNIWISDPLASRIWRFNIESEEFKSFKLDGKATQALALDHQGKIWYTDIPEKGFGYLEPETGSFKKISLPKIKPYNYDSIPIAIIADYQDNIWISVLTKNVILKYDQNLETFEEFEIPTPSGGPFALQVDSSGDIWFTETSAGKIGFINPQTKEIKEFMPEKKLESPESLLFDKSGNLWIAEHTATNIVKFNTVLETFERIPVIDPQSLPFGMAFDRYDNIWIAQHQIDKIAAFDPDNNQIIEIPIPTQTSWVQFMTSDEKNNIWFAEPEGNKLGTIKITEIPTTLTPNVIQFQLKYVEIAAPLIAMGIIATSLFFVKNINDKRRLNEIINT